jgi:hypothetical protein
MSGLADSNPSKRLSIEERLDRLEAFVASIVVEDDRLSFGADSQLAVVIIREIIYERGDA